MVTVTIYKDGKSWRAKWADRDVPIFDFVFGVGLMKKAKLMETFGMFKPVIVFQDAPDKSTEDAIQKVVEYIDRTYAGE